MATIRWPQGGQYIGDWRQGEKLAQNGRGMTWTDGSAATSANGAQCYNCHQVDKKEISFGTIGPSLWNYGKLRGVKDPADPRVGRHRAVHLGQAVEQQSLHGLFEHAALRSCQPAERAADPRRDGPAARPEVAGQPVNDGNPAP